MKLFVPDIGTKLTLAEPWSFTLFNEYRNQGLFGPATVTEGWKTVEKEVGSFVELLELTPPDNSFMRNVQYIFLRKEDFITDSRYNPTNLRTKYIYHQTYETPNTVRLPDRLFTMPQGIQLIVDRVYIKKGSSDFSSITFRTGDWTDKTLHHKRFWAKLVDVNNIVFVES